MPAPIQDFENDIYGKEINFRGNYKLKQKGVVLQYSHRHVDEILKCKDDLFYFLSKYYKVVHQDRGLMNIEIRDYQKDIIQHFLDNRFSISVFPRQVGKTTMVVGYILWYILFNEFKNVAILANKEKTAKEVLIRLQLAYENIPKWLQQGVINWNKLEVELENGCKVNVSATSAGAISGQAVSLLYIDEVSKIESNLWDEFYASSYPTISSSKESKIIFTSTPNGMNHFFKMCKEAESNASKFKLLKKTYKDIPQYNTKKFMEETIANIGKRRWEQEFGCTFLSSTMSLVEPEVLESIVTLPDIKRETLLYQTLINLSNGNFSEYINIFKDVEKDHEYVIGVDPAKITLESSGDSLAVQVLDVTYYPMKQCAKFLANTGVHYLQVPEFAVALAKYYNNAPLFIENNDQVGITICESIMNDWEYENVYQEKSGTNGLRTTVKTKKIGCLNLKMLLERKKLEIYDFDTLTQLSTFISNGNSYKAEIGCKDDLVMAIIHAIFFLQDAEYRERRNNILDLEFVSEENDMEPPNMFSSVDDFGEYLDDVGFSIKDFF